MQDPLNFWYQFLNMFSYILYIVDEPSHSDDYSSVNQMTISSADFAQTKKWLISINSGYSTVSSKRSTSKL